MFKLIKEKVQQQFNSFPQEQLLKIQLMHNELFDAYLKALPEEIRQEHNCSCCKSFLNNYGGIVYIKDNEVHTLWDFEVDYPYNNVPKILAEIVKANQIQNRFVSKTRQLGVDTNISLKTGIRWSHFHMRYNGTIVSELSSALGFASSQKQVFERALKEITLDAVDTVLELVAQNSLYRGESFLHTLQAFRKHKIAFESSKKEIYPWLEHNPSITGIRNSVIGTLLVDLSEGKDLEYSVRSYEQKVAPQNYRRPVALVTSAMLKKAEEDIEKLGLLPSLYRRHATLDDIPVKEVYFVDRSVKDESNVLMDIRKDVIVNPKQFSRIETVPFDKFVSDILPLTHSVEVLLENKHISKFINLTTASEEGSPGLFSWDNDIAWVYKDGNADSIKERVKQAGGDVEGDLRISLSWFNYDDLDLHVIEPTGERIYFSHKNSRLGGKLDVDMNAGSGTTRNAVENITYPSFRAMQKGIYIVEVNNYCKRESIDVGFEVEIEANGEVQIFSTANSIGDRHTIKVADIHFSSPNNITIVSKLPVTNKPPITKEVYGLSTQIFHKVNAIIPSPNFWGRNEIGNRHTFFLLEGAKTDTPIRGFFNEYLKSELQTHKKVFELLGAKATIQPNENQLAGIGFSSTQRDELICRLSGNTNRIIKIQF